MRNKRRVRRSLGILLVAGIAAFLVLPACGEEQTDGKTVLVVVSFDGFDKWEYVRTRRVFDQAGIRSTVASTQPGEASSEGSLTVTVDIVLADVDVELYDAIVFIGGGGVVWDLLNNEEAYEVVRQAAEQGKVLAAICVAPVILAEAGVLEGREATVYVSTSGYSPPDYWVVPLEAAGAIFIADDVVISYGEEGESTIITASGPDLARPFAEAILQAIGVTGEQGENGSDA